MASLLNTGAPPPDRRAYRRQPHATLDGAHATLKQDPLLLLLPRQQFGDALDAVEIDEVLCIEELAAALPDRRPGPRRRPSWFRGAHGACPRGPRKTPARRWRFLSTITFTPRCASRT